MEHTNLKESNYQNFVEFFDPEETLGNKNRSALHAAYLIKSAVDKGMRVNYNYHSFVHGEEGDSEESFKENRKGAIYFSIYPADLPESMNVNSPEFEYIRTQLAFISLKRTKILDYINKMVMKKYPSDKEWDYDKEFDSREIFAEKLYTLKYEKLVNGKLVQMPSNRITSENFNDFLEIFLTDKLLKEFDKIINPQVDQDTISDMTSSSKLKMK